MEPIILDLIENKQTDQNAASYGNGQTDDIDEGIQFIPLDMPPCYFKICLDHK
jgi:hypothetical protein